MHCVVSLLADSQLHDCSFQVQVVALEVQNVKRAISRYGTLPKGARIGAYLESLRQNGVDADGGQPNSDLPAPASPALLSMTKMSCAQPGNMIRSNSSGGFQPTSISSSLARNRAAPPSLADLEFPPPPPPEELECDDVTNLRPSAEEASVRFGVNLRRREPSTDSCASAKSERSTKKVVDSRQHREEPSPSPDDSPHSLPPSPPGPAKEDGEANEKSSTSRNMYKSVLPGIMKEMMELKLVSDNKVKSKDENESQPKDGSEGGKSNAVKSNRFKVQLKKVDPKKATEDAPVEMKVRLKKVNNGKTSTVLKEGTRTSNGEPPSSNEEEDKRCSRGI
jgi:abelson tyrosine-protein kinase 1